MEGKATVYILTPLYNPLTNICSWASWTYSFCTADIENFRKNQVKNMTMLWFTFPLLVVRLWDMNLNTAPAGGSHSASPAPNHPKDHQQELISGTLRQFVNVYFNSFAPSLWKIYWFTVSLNTQNPTLYLQKYLSGLLGLLEQYLVTWHSSTCSLSIPLAAPFGHVQNELGYSD